MTDQLIMDEKRFNKIFGFICFGCTALLTLIFFLVFGKIPDDNQQSANMALAFAMSGFGVLTAYLVGASPDKKRPETTASANTTVLQLNWLGDYAVPPQNPKVNDAYVNTTSNKNYYWTGSAWEITTQNPA